MKRIEAAAALLLSLAAVATAWTGYQANRWNGEQAKAAGRTSALRIGATRAENVANDQTQVDIALYSQWADAFTSGNNALEQFVRDRFRPEFKPAFDAWLATNPLTTSGAPSTPFAMSEYRVAAKQQAIAIDRQANASALAVQEYIQRSANYVLGVLLLAVALFFAGISTKLTSDRLRVAMLAIGWLVFVGTVVWMATSPVSVSV